MSLLANPREERFARFVANGMPAGKAAYRAGYASDSGDKDSARSRGCRLMKLERVRKRIKEIQDERLKRYDISAERILLETAMIAFANIKELFDEDGNLLGVDEMPSELASAISSIKVTETRRESGDDAVTTSQLKEFKFWSKMEALTLLARIRGMLTDKTEHSFDLSGLTDEQLLALREIRAKLGPAAP